MCTVSFIPANDSFFITSNRDEKNSRKRALPPFVYELKSGKLIYPKDADAGGSWIALHENGNVSVLLNGAFEKHISRPPYRLSRGKIFMEIAGSDKMFESFRKLSLEEIEPFTLILLDAGHLHECRWDGENKYQHELRVDQPQIWSSATLYDACTVRKREQWFKKFLKDDTQPTSEDILRFHQFTGNGDKQNDLQMERAGQYLTVSITSIMVNRHRGSMKYIDLQEKKIYERKIELISTCETL